jgi:hypothetical protein
VTKNVLQDYGVQPQMKKKDESFVDFMQRTTWFTAMTKALQKHSEFMRPELGDYPNMEYGFPEPPKGTLDIPSELKDSELLPGAGPCAISCYAPLYCDDNVKCHANLYNCPPGVDRRSCSDAQAWAASNINTGEKLTIVRSGLDAKTGSTIGTPVFPIEIKPGSSGVWAHWPEAPSDQILVTMVDATGVHCQTKLSVFCRQEDCCHRSDYVKMTFDDPNTPDVISPGGSITVYVLNGCGPFVWSVSGAGYSFATSVTTARQNTLSLVNGFCGNGVGEAAAIGTVTITDECGTGVSGIIRSTGGTWKNLYVCAACPAGCIYGDCGDRDGLCDVQAYVYLSGNYYREYYTGRNCYKSNPCSSWKKDEVCVDACQFTPSKSAMADFGQTCTCNDGTTSQMCKYSSVNYQYWGCP